MLKIKSILTVTVNTRDYEFSCPPDAPLSDALDANNQVNAFLLGRIEQAKNAKASEAPACPECPEMPPIDLSSTEEVK